MHNRLFCDTWGIIMGIVGTVFAGISLLFLIFTFSPLGYNYIYRNCVFNDPSFCPKDVATFALHISGCAFILGCITTWIFLMAAGKYNERKWPQFLNLFLHVVTEAAILTAAVMITIITPEIPSEEDDDFFTPLNYIYMGFAWTSFGFFTPNFVLAIVVFAYVPRNNELCCGEPYVEHGLAAVPPPNYQGYAQNPGYPYQGHPQTPSYGYPQEGYSPQGYSPHAQSPYGYSHYGHPVPHGYSPTGYSPNGYQSLQ